MNQPALLLSMIYLLASASVAADTGTGWDGTWISINTAQRTLSVMEDNRTVRSFTNISVGRAGVTLALPGGRTGAVSTNELHHQDDRRVGEPGAERSG